MTVQLTLRFIPYVTLTVSGTTTTGLGTVLGKRREEGREGGRKGGREEGREEEGGREEERLNNYKKH